jgi:hypothetical protein
MMLNKPLGVVHINYTSARPAAMLAIGYRGSAITVDELQPGTDYDLGDPWHGVYDKIVLVFVGLDNSQLQVTLKAEVAPLGVDDGVAARTLSLSGSMPNPVSAGGTIGFSTVASAPVTMKLYDTRGELVATLIDGERLAEGDHAVLFDAAGLASGYYVLRLSQGASIVSRSVIVAK